MRHIGDLRMTKRKSKMPEVSRPNSPTSASPPRKAHATASLPAFALSSCWARRCSVRAVLADLTDDFFPIEITTWGP
eukprot:SAG25_NODE_103_length_15482_cov_9.187415_2_plen_77_part_00